MAALTPSLTSSSCCGTSYLEVLRPDVAAALFPDASDLADLHFKFSGQEPMLNRYTIGGSFDPHQDGHALTGTCRKVGRYM